MSYQILVTALTLAGASIVVFCSFCRLQIMTKDTAKRSARAAFWALASTGLTAIFFAIGYGWKPDLIHCAAFASVAYLQLVNRVGWGKGVPHTYQKKQVT